MYVRAVLQEGVNDEAYLVPQKTVIRNSRGQPVVQLLTKNATIQNLEGVYNVTPRILTTDRAIGNNWLVTSGLKDGDRVVVDGLQKIRPGMAVKGTQEQLPADSVPRGTPAGSEKSANATRNVNATDDKQSPPANGTAGSASGKQ